MLRRFLRHPDGLMKPARLHDEFDRLVMDAPPHPAPEVPRPPDPGVAAAPDTNALPAPDADEAGTNRHEAQMAQASDLEQIAGLEVGVIGAGAVASWASLLLSFYGLQLHVFDLDRVTLSNTLVARTIYSRPHIGMYKVDALKQILGMLCPETTVHAYPHNLDEVPDIELERLAQRCGLFLGLIDHPDSLIRLNRIVYPRATMICGGLHRGARTGHVIVTAMGVPCLRCSLELNGQQQMRTLNAEAGLGCDISRTAHMIATMALDLLLAQVNHRPITRWDPRRNIAFLTNYATTDSPEGPAVIYDSATADPNCSVCGPHVQGESS